MFDAMLWFGVLSGIVTATLTFIFNSSTPLQLGPAPFFGGAALAILCILVLLVRHIAWR